jgi:hypothetical protein
MTRVSVVYGTVTDCMGKKHTGYFVTEDGRVSGYPDKDETHAIIRAKSIAGLRTGIYIEPKNLPKSTP